MTIHKKMLSLVLAAAMSVAACGFALSVHAASGENADGLRLSDYKTVAENGAKSDNISNHDYNAYGSYPNGWNWGNVAKSYLQNNADGTLSRVEAIGDSVTVETYSSDFQWKSSRTLSLELPLFGGFFSGSKYNFLVCGQENPDESDDVEVVRVIKYDKSWKRLGSASFSAVNTYVPFDAGTVSMTEDNDTLYIHTCHEMYQSSDGYHHQANMTFFVEKETMTDTYRNFRVWNISSGYVSHSFNQVIRTDGQYVYTADHGDAYPRSVVLVKRQNSGGNFSTVQYGDVLSIQGDVGANQTKATLGGMELSSDNLLTVGTSVTQDDQFDSRTQKNVFLAVTGKNALSAGSFSFQWLTHYDDNDSVTVENPWIVRLGEDSFMLLWEEVVQTDSSKTLHCVTLNGNGRPTSDEVVFTADAVTEGLSDCAPILRGNQVVWYSTGQNNSQWWNTTTTAPSFYSIPANLHIGGITEQPKDASRAVDDKVTFSVKATGSGISYKWYYKKATDSSWTAWKNGNSATLSVPVYASWNGAQFYCVVCDNEGGIYQSQAATLTVLPKITDQPKDATGVVNDKVTFSVKATGSGISYQWYYKKADATSWTACKNGTSATLSAPVYASWNNTKFYCKLTDANGQTLNSGSAKMLVGMQITQQPTDATGAVNDKVTFSVVATGSGVKYQWYYKKTDATSWTAWKNGTSATLTAPVYASWHNAKFYCKLTDANGKTLNSGSAKMLVGQALTVTQQPSDASGYVNDKVTFSVKATGSGVKYQWYYKKADATSWTAWKNGTSATLTAPVYASWHNAKFYCKLTDSAGKTLNSGSAKMLVAMKITSQPTDASGAVNEKVTFSVKATGSGVKYQWYYKKADATSWTAWKNGTSATLTATVYASWHNAKFYCKLTDSSGKTLNSGSAKMLVTPSLTVKITPQTAYATIYESARLTVTSSGGSGKYTYRWQYLDWEGKWTDGRVMQNTAATSDEYLISIPFIDLNGGGETYLKCRCVVTDSSGHSATTATVTVYQKQ